MTPISELKAALASMDAGVNYSAKDLRAVVEPALVEAEGQIAVLLERLKYARRFVSDSADKPWIDEALANTHEAATAYLAQVRREARLEGMRTMKEWCAVRCEEEISDGWDKSEQYNDQTAKRCADGVRAIKEIP